MHQILVHNIWFHKTNTNKLILCNSKIPLSSIDRSHSHTQNIPPPLRKGWGDYGSQMIGSDVVGTVSGYDMTMQSCVHSNCDCLHTERDRDTERQRKRKSQRSLEEEGLLGRKKGSTYRKELSGKGWVWSQHIVYKYDIDKAKRI